MIIRRNTDGVPGFPDKDLRWYENHYPFGEIGSGMEDTPGDDMTAGLGTYAVSWDPNFRFPGQYQDEDMKPFVQNHFREYMPEWAIYNSTDPITSSNYLIIHHDSFWPPYNYAGNNALLFSDGLGLQLDTDCCQAEHRRALVDAKLRVLKVLSDMQAGGSNTTVERGGPIDPWGEGCKTSCNNRRPSTRCNPSFVRYTDPCVLDCIIKHEMIHQDQCRGGYWPNCEVIFIGLLGSPSCGFKQVEYEKCDSRVPYEIPAYTGQLTCINRKLK